MLQREPNELTDCLEVGVIITTGLCDPFSKSSVHEICSLSVRCLFPPVFEECIDPENRRDRF